MTPPPRPPVPRTFAAAEPPAPAEPGTDADHLAAAVMASPLVAGLHGGAFGEVATYLPGRQITGIRITDSDLEVHVVGRFPATAAEIAAQVRAAAAPWGRGLPINVTIADLAVPGRPVAAQPAPVRPDPGMGEPHADASSSGPAMATPPGPTTTVHGARTMNVTLLGP